MFPSRELMTKEQKPEQKRAEVFLFTSFQGGVGKTTSALRFARAFQAASGSKGVFFEFNMFAPSYLAELFGEESGLKRSLINYYMSDWGDIQAENFDDSFTTNDGLMMIPFSGAAKKESLELEFSFSEADLIPLLDRLLKLFSQTGRFVVVDIVMGFSPLQLFWMKKADIIHYLYTSQFPSPSFAQKFSRELETRPYLKNRVVWLHNLVDPDVDNPEHRMFSREFSIPIVEELNERGESEKLDMVFCELAKKAMEKSSAQKEEESPEPPKASFSEELQVYQQNLRTEIVAGLEKRFGLSDQELRRKVERNIDSAFDREPPPAVEGMDVRGETKRLLVDEILGLGPLEEFMRDADVDEIMVNGPDKVFVEKRGKLLLTGKTFKNSDHVKTVIDRILMPVGRMVNERTPYVDARLGDGSRVHAIIPPLSLNGPMLTIRRFARVPYAMEDLIYRFKSITPKVGEFLKLCVSLRQNIIVSGGASSGKTTLLNVLSSFINPSERIISIEDSAELRLNLQNLGRLEARQQGTEAKNQVTIRDLVRNSLRMRPDRIIVGECRGPEALDMLQAMNTGHDGSLTTLHANSPRDALARLETMVLLAGVELPLRAVREQIAGSVNIIVQATRLADGSRKIQEVVEVFGIEDTIIKTETIYKFCQKWIDEHGRVFGEIIPTGYIPAFIRNMPENLLEKTRHLFENGKEKLSS